MAQDDEKPRHKVTVSGFQVARTELTQSQWKSVVVAAQAAHDPDAAMLKTDPATFKGDILPVESVSWCDAARFSNALSRLEGLTPAYTVHTDCENGGAVAWDKRSTGYRLPTEAEWEYAARAGTQTHWSFGDDVGQLRDFANIADQSTFREHPDQDWTIEWDDGFPDTAPVCSFRPNPWDLCDMHGNVDEWTWDWYASKMTNDEQTNPDGAASGDRRVIRGGTWGSIDGTRAADRDRSSPWMEVLILGFRLVRPLPVPVPPGP